MCKLSIVRKKEMVDKTKLLNTKEFKYYIKKIFLRLNFGITH